MSILKSGFRRNELGSYVLSMLSMFGLWGCGSGVSFDLSAESDTGPVGAYLNDRITNKSTLSFDVSSGEGGREVEIVEDGAVLGSAFLNENSGAATITITLNNENKMPSGEDPDKDGYDHELILRYADGGEIARETIRLDTVKPATPVLKFAYDTTADKLLNSTFKDSGGGEELVAYEVSEVEDGSTVRLYGASGEELTELRSVSGDTQIMRARVTAVESVTAVVFDKAGNQSSDSNVLSIRAPVSLAATSGGDGDVWEGFDEYLNLSLGEGGTWELATSLVSSGIVYFDREGADEILEVRSSGIAHDIKVTLAEGRWYVRLDGADEEYLIGVGGDYSGEIA